MSRASPGDGGYPNVTPNVAWAMGWKEKRERRKGRWWRYRMEAKGEGEGDEREEEKKGGRRGKRRKRSGGGKEIKEKGGKGNEE